MVFVDESFFADLAFVSLCSDVDNCVCTQIFFSETFKWTHGTLDVFYAIVSSFVLIHVRPKFKAFLANVTRVSLDFGMGQKMFFEFDSAVCGVIANGAILKDV